MKISSTKIALIVLTIVLIILCIHYLKSDSSTAEIADSPTQTITQADVASPEQVPLDINLPKPMFTTGPYPLRVPNLEELRGRPRPPFLAPLGTKNVALGKPVFSSDDQPIIGEIEMITDGDKEAGKSSYVELSPLLQYVTIDLKAEHNIYAIVIWHYHRRHRVYYDVVVQVANDPDFINISTLFNNDIDNSAGFGIGTDKHYIEINEGKLIDAGGICGRYIRLYSNGNSDNDLNHYIEVEVYGKPSL